MEELTIPILSQEAKAFVAVESTYPEASIYGVTDGKAVGTYFEHKFKAYLTSRYSFRMGSAAKGNRLPGPRS